MTLEEKLAEVNATLSDVAVQSAFRSLISTGNPEAVAQSLDSAANMQQSISIHLQLFRDNLTYGDRPGDTPPSARFAMLVGSMSTLSKNMPDILDQLKAALPESKNHQQALETIGTFATRMGELAQELVIMLAPARTR
ncbi:MAG: hypothetical protein KGJ06_08500 [Pseudomonadota bacterium]|nr:hypothetical protein [Pseudomonadota bacterium]